jgi:hypothetical protein
MTQKELDKWFNNLSSEEMAEAFPSLYEEVMMSADPCVNINTFYKEAKSDWKNMTKEEKEYLYNLITEL